MTEQRHHDGGAGTAHSSPVQHSGRSENPADASASTTQTGPEAVAGPFTLRETVIGVSVLIMFVGTILPFVDGVNLWRTFSLFFLGIGILLPVIALALLVGRRLGGKGLRVGSLSVDQFASVTAVLAAAFFFLQTVTTFGIGSFIALIGSVGFFVATVGGPHLGIFKPDFADRPSSSAHRIAREALPARPRPPKPVPAETVSGWDESGQESPGATASAGPSSAGHTAGYAVTGYTAGQGATAVQGAGGLFGTAHRSQQDAGDKAPEPQVAAAHDARTAQAAQGAQTAQAAQGAQVTSAAQGTQVTPTTQAAQVTPAAQAAQAQADPSTQAPAQSAAASAGQQGPAPTTAQPKIEDARERTAGQQPQAQQAAHPRTESISATRNADDDESVLEAFWFAVGTPRSVVDEQTGAPLFVLQPGDWEVGIEDRGHEFLVQDKRTGRVGVMRDLRNIERAPREG